MEKTKYINGPINAVRLEGIIFGKKKVIYLFMDHHSDVTYQTQCQTFLSTDFTTYISKELQKIDKEHIDFFFEMGKSFLSLPSSSYRQRYIDEIAKFFKSVIRFEKDKNIGTVYGKHIRFHWIDVRDYFKSQINTYIDATLQILTNARCTGGADAGIFTNVFNQLNMLNSKMIYILSLFDKSLMSNKTDTIKGGTIKSDYGDYINMKIQNIMAKINNKYTHKESYGKISKLYKIVISKFENIVRKIDDTLIFIAEYQKYSKAYVKDGTSINRLNVTKNGTLTYGSDFTHKTETINKLYLDAYNLDYDLTMSFALLVDLYFLRRFIDKDYIDHAIVYTGIAHSTQYIFTLIRDFDMTITHASYIKTDIDKAMKVIRSKKEYDIDIDKLFYPPTLMQCTDISSFPERFE
jgi:hypothetical protein